MSEGLGISLHAASVKRGSRWALRDLSLDLAPGSRWALIGENGSGKTQLLKLLCADVWPTPTGREQRIYHCAGAPIDVIEAKSRIAYIGAERQDKYARYGWNFAVRDVVATGLYRSDILLQPVGAQDQARVATVLRACGLIRLSARRFLTLSYGQQRLVLLARALIQEPDWLLLDEFYNGLDLQYRARVDRILGTLRKRGQAWIAAAHRAEDVPRGTGRLLELAHGRVRFVGRLRRAVVAGLDHKARARRSGLPRPAMQPPNARPPLIPPLLRLAKVDLFVEYHPVLRDLNWELRDREHWAVFGANGSGKSSFLRLLYGDLAPALGGTIERREHARGAPIDEWKRRVGLVSPQLQTDYDVNVSVMELVASGRHASIGLALPATRQDERAALRWLKFVGLSRYSLQRPRELSYGELRRALLARALVADPELLLLDEPLTGLDPEQRAFMRQVMEDLMARRRTLIMAVHHADDLPRGITHALHLHKRRASAINYQSGT